jgi:hypothetical protein
LSKPKLIKSCRAEEEEEEEEEEEDLPTCIAQCLNQLRHRVPPTILTYKNFTFCSHSVFVCFVRISEQTAIISLYSIN